MYNRSLSPQVSYSLESLAKSFFYYLQKKPMKAISVTEICDRAGLSRRTFYRNCDTKEDLILYACDRLIVALLETVDFSSEDARQLYLNYFEYWGQHKMFLRCLVEYKLYGSFVERFVQNCSRQMRFPLQEQAFSKKKDVERYRFFCNSFLLGGLSRMLYAWAESDFSLSEQELTESILFLVSDNKKATAVPRQ